jgi:DNA-directed RNA polymerase subunit RPC12/RpoP
MVVYSKEQFIQAHENISIPYYNHSYDRYVRDAICGSCGHTLGEQNKYPDLFKEFRYDDNSKNEWKHCPYCGDKLIL